MPMSRQAESQRSKAERRRALLGSYQPLAGVHDELMDADGHVRPQWENLLDEWTN